MLKKKYRCRSAQIESLWIKILGGFILLIILTNIGMVLFYFDHGKTGLWLGITKPWRSITSSPDRQKDQQTPKDTFRKHQTKDRKNKKAESLPLILWWNPIPGQRGEDIHCGPLSCHVTTNREVWQQHDLLIISFYGPFLSVRELPVPRGEGHLWALFHDESPKNMDFLFSHRVVMELFNYTSTFRRHSDMPIPTQWLVDVKDLLSSKYTVPVETKSQLRHGPQLLAPVVYVQSDCNVPSDRDHFVRLLRRFVPVDCYGDCLHNREFPGGDSLRIRKNISAMMSEDFYRLLAKYKFAIAIENAVCPGYITEKLWRPLQLGVVPIVFGAPDIKEFLPSKTSALVVDDFETAGKLAQEIAYYDSHDAEYIKLRDFKDTGITNPALLAHLKNRWTSSNYRVQMVEDYHCMLCQKLHEAISSRESGRPIPPSVASTDHYGCPKPGKFNEKGQYTAKPNMHWSQPLAHSRAVACLMRKIIDTATRIFSYDAFEFQVQLTDENFELMCQNYFD
ncbi:hypothetical protein ACOMHN_047849 [Nucella lapillus]